MTRSRTPPLVLFGLSLMAGANGWLLLATVQHVMSADRAETEQPGWTPRLPRLEDAQTLTTATVTHQEILAHPIFSRSRAPYVPPAPPAPKSAPPPAVFIDPELVLGGVMVHGTVKKAYLFQKTNQNGAWVGEGDDFVGWRVQSITAEAAKLQKETHVIEVRLYPER